MAQTYGPPTGESLLPDFVHQDTLGGSEQFAQESAFKDFKNQFGRNPSQSELTSLAQAYFTGDKNQLNHSGGRAAIAQYFSSLANSPSNQAAREQSQHEQDAPKYYDSVNQQFKSVLGRDASDDEKSHFGSLMASGNVDAYTIGQFLNALPETVQQKDKAFRDSLAGDLQKSDAQYYNEQVLPSIQSTFANQGRSVDSSGFKNAVALAAQQQNRQREGFLSNLSASQYGNSQDLAQKSYQQAYGNYQGLQDYSRQRSAQMQDATQNRLNDIGDYTMQKQAYDEYLSRYGKRSKGAAIGSLAGGVIGGAAGAYAGGPAGASAGYSAGSGLGSGIGSFF